MPRPWISANLATTADGKIAPVIKQPTQWTSAIDQQRLQSLRAQADALLIGHGTLEIEKSTLWVDDKPADQQPLRCVASRQGQFDFAAPLFTSPGGTVHVLAEGAVAMDEARDVIVHQGDLASFITGLARDYAVKKLHCEGGGELIRALAELDWLDEIHLTLCGHTLFGGRMAATLTGLPSEWLNRSAHYELTHFEPIAETAECFLSYRRVDSL